ncbi:hypothetical protein [Dietzia sp. CQ4]|uniref:hypothetical protein n=1 Tax=Dietzia sp. (strain CQ4) TaxID=370437 RepID=UPI0019D60843|nr:hypothetical protein [Dietzia sp. CQ4]
MTAQPASQSMIRAPLSGYPRSVLITPASHTAAGAGTTAVAVGGAVVVAREARVEVAVVLGPAGAVTSGDVSSRDRISATVVTVATRTPTTTTTARAA